MYSNKQYKQYFNFQKMVHDCLINAIQILKAMLHASSSSVIQKIRRVIKVFFFCSLHQDHLAVLVIHLHTAATVASLLFSFVDWSLEHLFVSLPSQQSHVVVCTGGGHPKGDFIPLQGMSKLNARRISLIPSLYLSWFQKERTLLKTLFEQFHLRFISTSIYLL